MIMISLQTFKHNLPRSRWHSIGRHVGVAVTTRSHRSVGPSLRDYHFDADVQPVNAVTAIPFFLCQTSLQRQGQLPGGTGSQWQGGRFCADVGLWGETKYHRRSASYINQTPLLPSRWMSSRQRIDFRECNSLGEMIEMAHDNLEALSARDISAFWTQVPKLLRQGRQRLLGENPNASNQLESILVHTLECMGSFSYRDLAQTTLGMAKIVKQIGNKGRGIPRGNPLQPLQELFGRNVNSDNTQFIFNHIAAASIPTLSEFDSRHLSNFVYAFGLVEHKLEFEDGSTFFDELADEVLPRLETFNPRDLSNILWAYANAKASNHNIFQKAGKTIIDFGLLKSFNSQDISNTVWAYATAEQHHPELFKKLGDQIQAMESLQEFNEQALANTVWAYATLNEPSPKLFNKVADHITSLDNLERFNPQNLANTVWAYATAVESNPKLFKEVADHIIALDSLERFIPQDLSNTVWAYATANESNPKLFQKVADHITELGSLEEFTPQNLSNTVWAYATANESNSQLFKKVADHIGARNDLERFNEQNLANIAWSFSVANVSAPSLFNNDFINACLEKDSKFLLDHQCQLYQWQLWQDELKTNIRLPTSLENKCYDAFISRLPTPSNLQNDVISELSLLGLNPDEEKLTERGYRLDAYVEINGEKIGIEVDGPSHFLGRKPTGNTVLKHRQIANLEGIRVVSVPYWKWGKLRKDSKKKQLYLRKLLCLN